MELKALTLTNFRVFKKETEIPFSPLTIITGANSSGKSSVFKALMLLQENLKEKDNNLARLNFTSGKHVLGTFDSIRNYEWNMDEENIKDTIIFQLRFENDKSNEFWASIKDFFLTLEYRQDRNNGELVRYQIDVTQKSDETLKQLLKAEKSKAEKSKIKLDIDLAWFILSMDSEKVLPQNMKPVKAIPIEVLNRQREELIQKHQENRDVALANIVFPENIKIEVNGLRNQIIEKEKELSELEKKTNETIHEWDNLIRDENSSEDDINQITLEVQNIESSFSIEKERIYNQIESIEEQIKALQEESILKKRLEEEEILNNKIKDENLTDIFKFTEHTHSLIEREISKGITLYLINRAKAEIKDDKISLLKDEISLRNGQTIINYLLAETHNWKSDGAITDTLSSLYLEDLPMWDNQDILFCQHIMEKITLESLYDKGERNAIARFLINSIKSIISESQATMAFSNISSVRGIQKRVYEISDNDYPLEEAGRILLDLLNEEKEEAKIESRKEERAKSTKAQTALEFIRKWLVEFEIGEDIDVSVVDGSYANLRIKQTKRWINLPDLGLGITQFLPILIHISDKLKTRQLLAIEEPEAHLHPKYQSRLADMFAEAIDKGVRFVIETHSEYFIRSLQVLIANKKIETNDIRLYYFIPSSSKSFEEIEVKTDGSIIENYEKYWAGFFDESERLKQEKDAVLDVLEGRKVVFCEGDDDKYYKHLDAINLRFYGLTDGCTAIYAKICTNNEVYGLRDKDYFTVDEINEIMKVYPNYSILEYLSVESYLFHPENILEKYPNFDVDGYKSDILRIKTKHQGMISSSLQARRDKYSEMKDNKLRTMKRNEAKEREKIIKDLFSDEFEKFYAYFNMKPNSEYGFEPANLKRQLNITTKEDVENLQKELAQTEWFKVKIGKILESILEKPNTENQATVVDLK